MSALAAKGRYKMILTLRQRCVKEKPVMQEDHCSKLNSISYTYFHLSFSPERVYLPIGSAC